MRPQVHISLIGAACALVVLAVGALASLLDTRTYDNVAVVTAAPAPTVTAPNATGVAAIIAPTQVVMLSAARPTSIAEIEALESPHMPSAIPATAVAAKPAALREALIVAPTVMPQPTAELTVEPSAAVAILPSPSPMPTSKLRLVGPRPAAHAAPTPAAEPTAMSPTETAIPIATSHPPRKGPQADTTAETPTEMIDPTAVPTPSAEAPTEAIEPTMPPEPPRPRETRAPTTPPQLPVEPAQPTEAPIASLASDYP